VWEVAPTEATPRRSLALEAAPVLSEHLLGQLSVRTTSASPE
jgi:hypothetical protein